jgi:hypothetical protein
MDRRNRTILSVILAVGGAGALAMLAGCPRGGGPAGPLTVSPTTYQQFVEAFYTGILAVQVADTEHALPSLERAHKLVPDEPAILANLAIAYMGSSNPTAAAEPLKKAQELAPNNAEIEFLLAAVANKNGDSAQVLAHLRKAIQLDPDDPRFYWALAKTLDNQGTPEAGKEAVQQLQRILELRPGNIHALVELAVLAVSLDDLTLLKSSLDELAKQAVDWPAETRGYLERAQNASTSASAARGPVSMMKNVLKAMSKAKGDLRVVQGPGASWDQVEPITRFMRLPQPETSPSAPDTTLAFEPAPLAPERSSWATSEVLAPGEPADAQGGPTAADGPAVPMYVKGNTLVVGGTPTSTLAFPGTPAPVGVALVDLQRDYLRDLALVGSGGLKLFRQSAGSKWADVTAPAKLPGALLKTAYAGAWSADIDQDGDMDLILSPAAGEPLALRNNLDGTWTEQHPFRGVTGIRALTFGDLDSDFDADLVMLDAAGKPSVILNERSGAFRLASFPAPDQPVAAVAIADSDSDGTLELTTLGGDGAVRRYVTDAAATKWTGTDVTRSEPAGKGSARVSWADLDNNGAPDLVVSGESGTQVWLGTGKGAVQSTALKVDGQVTSILDLENDGRLDLVGLGADGKPARFDNHGSAAYHWLLLRVRNLKTIRDPRSPNLVNSFGIGGSVELRAGLLYQKQTITGPTLHFGLGSMSRVNAVRFAWPDGQTDVQGEFELPGDKVVAAVQRNDTSCPWLFAFDGQQMKFVTDILWKSPLGLRINAQDTAGISQTRDWVVVRGDQLQPKDGFYDLAITAELWETHYFDHVALMAVDHPAGTEVRVDERFSIPQPPLKLHPMTATVPVSRATDDLGQDATELVREADNRHVDSFGQGELQGITREHFLEVELPATTPSTGPLWLVGYGWIFPTSGTVNYFIGQGRHTPPTGLSLEVPDGKGGWRTARSGLGFPAGKTKTVLLDLTGLFPAGSKAPRKLRLRTNLEIYWDALGVAVPLKGAEIKTRTILPTEADLRYRGYSTLMSNRRSEAAIPGYGRIESTGPRWNDLVGFVTRFGDVRELLKGVDDRYVIMNAGDEIRLRFPALPAPAKGWTRDFVFVSDGWEKDGDFATAFSKTVLPLPSHADTKYTTPPTTLENDPVFRAHRADWLKFHTRYITPDRHVNALLPPRSGLATTSAGSPPRGSR